MCVVQVQLYALRKINMIGCTFAAIGPFAEWDMPGQNVEPTPLGEEPDECNLLGNESWP